MKPPFQEPVEAVIESLGTDARHGLTGAEAKSRLEREGPNELKAEPVVKSAPQENTPLQKELDRIGKRLGAVVIAIAVIMIVTIVLVEKVRGLPAFFDVLILGVALASAAVPEGLPFAGGQLKLFFSRKKVLRQGSIEK
jgi:magnesium-transporting ATPase (P-type)